jgi:hypothetical protein
MEQIQGFLYVQPGVPSAENKDDCLPNCYDSLCGVGVGGNCCVIRLAIPCPTDVFMLIVLPDYVDQQGGIYLRSQGRANVHNNDIVGIFSYNIFVGIAVATIFGSGFFFDLFWPERHETPAVKMAWKISSVVVSFMAFADAIALTVSPQVSHALDTLIIRPRSSLQLDPHIFEVYRPNMRASSSSRTVPQTLYIDTMRTAWHLL